MVVLHAQMVCNAHGCNLHVLHYQLPKFVVKITIPHGVIGPHKLMKSTSYGTDRQTDICHISVYAASDMLALRAWEINSPRRLVQVF